MNTRDIDLEALFQDEKPKDKKPASNDLFSGLFLQDKKTKQEKKKPKGNEQQHEYLRLADKSSTKAKAQVKKIKDEQSMTQQQLKAKKQIERVTARFERAKKESSNISNGERFMPKVIDPFGNGNTQTKPTSSTKPEKSNGESRQKTHAKPPSKVEAKKEKVQEKQKQRKLAAMEAKKKENEQREKRQRQKEKLREQQRVREKERDRREQAKTRKEESSSSSGSSSSGEEQEEVFNWRKQIRSLTGYNPQDKKYKIRDAQEIRESGFDRIAGEDRKSLRYGLMEEEQDLRREQAKRRRQMQKHGYRH